MKNYELLLIISGKVKEPDVPPIVEEIKKIFTKHAAKILDEAVWGNMRLAYEIKHQTSGTYVLWHLGIEPAQTAALSSDLQVADGILRFLLIEAPKHGKTIEPPNKRTEEKAEEKEGGRVEVGGRAESREKKAIGVGETETTEKGEKVSPQSTGSTDEPTKVSSAKKPPEEAVKPASGEDLDKRLDEILGEEI